LKLESIHSDLRDGTTKKPKFGLDILECQSSGNHLKEYPEVLSRLSRQAGSIETKVSAAKLHNTKEKKQKGATPKKKLRDVDWNREIHKGET